MGLCSTHRCILGAAGTGGGSRRWCVGDRGSSALNLYGAAGLCEGRAQAQRSPVQVRPDHSTAQHSAGLQGSAQRILVQCSTASTGSTVHLGVGQRWFWSGELQGLVRSSGV
jgi:hypothetical protein